MRRVLEVYGLLLIVVLACWPSALAFHGLWTNDAALGNSHGYLVALVSLALILQSRRELAAVDVRPCAPALALVFMLSVAWLVFWQAGLQDAHLALVPLIAAAAIFAVFGFPTLRVLLFPLAFFYFAEPLWEAFTVPLQDLTVAVQRALMSWAGLPAQVDGYFIRFPNGTFEIESGCSGLHFLVVGLAVAALYGELSKDSVSVRLFWMMIMGVLALVANWLRVFTVIIAGYQTDMRHYLVSVDHYRFGWILFIVLMAVFLYVTSRFPSRGFRRHREPVHRPAAPTGAVAWLGATLSIIALPAIAYVKHATGSAFPTRSVVELPQAQAPWAAGPEVSRADAWQPRFINATASELRTYRAPDGEPVDLFSVIYQRQRQNAELIAYGNSLFGENSMPAAAASLMETRSGPWRTAVAVTHHGQRSVFMWRYLIGERIFVRPLASQLWYGVAALRQPPASSLIALRTECVPNCERARARLESFAVANCLRPACGAIVEPRVLTSSSKGATEAPHDPRQALP